MRKLFAVMALAATTATPALAQSMGRPFNVGVEAGFYFDGSDFAVGGRYENALNTLLPSVPGLRAAFSGDYLFISNTTTLDFNLNVLYDINLAGSPIKPYAGGGLNYTHSSRSGGGSTSASGLGLAGGIKLSGNLYVEMRAALRSGGGLSLFVGKLF